MKKILKQKDFIFLGVILFSVFVFFYPFFLQNKVPIPADTVIGLYNPFRDLYVQEYPNGIPYKNYLLTDPVRQQYVWKKLSIDMYKKGQLPVWNPYEMAGKPLLANFQSGVFYPVNFILFLQPFFMSWSIYILLQLILAAIFMYFYLRLFRLTYTSCILGTFTWIYSGFFISWLEWGNIVHTALWLPMILLAVHKLIENSSRRWEFVWFFALIGSTCAAFFAGHLQSFFYMSVFLIPYILLLWFLRGRNLKKLFSLFTYLVIFITVTSIQWVPTLQFIDLSGRVSDQSFNNPGWFMPYENLIQFLSPDFFGNPSTLNYFGVFNYGEFIGYTGILSLLCVLYAVFFRRDRKTYFFAFILIVSLLFALENPISLIPFIFKFPFISTAQPTRLLILTCFSLAVLSSFGLDFFQRKKSKMYIPILVIGVILASLWASILFFPQIFPGDNELAVSKSNLRLPTGLYIISSCLLLIYSRARLKRIQQVLLIAVIAIALADLLRFGWKYTPFVDKSYVFPSTQITSYISRDSGLFRIAATDSQILPPNFATAYGISSIEGYDPLYLNNYASVIAANERVDHSIAEPFGFNRIITPRNIESNFMNFLNVKYILSFNNLDKTRYELILKEGKTKLYKNKEVLPRVFFVKNLVYLPDKAEIAKRMHVTNLEDTAFLQGDPKNNMKYSQGSVSIREYSPNKIVLETQNKGDGLLIISDVYYPSFRAQVDSNDAKIMQVNNAFRGIEVPKGAHVVTLTGSLF